MQGLRFSGASGLSPTLTHTRQREVWASSMTVLGTLVDLIADR